MTPYMHGHSRETKDYRTSWLVCGSANGLRVRVSGWVLGVCGGGGLGGDESVAEDKTETSSGEGWSLDQ